MEFEHPVYFDKEEARNWGEYYGASAQTGSGYRQLVGAGIPGFNADLRQRGFGIPGGFHGDPRMRGRFFPGIGFLSKLLPVVGSIAVKSFAEPVKNLATDIFSGKDPLESVARAGLDSIKGVARNVIGEFTGQNGNGSHKRKKKIVRKSKPQKTVEKIEEEN